MLLTSELLWWHCLHLSGQFLESFVPFEWTLGLLLGCHVHFPLVLAFLLLVLNDGYFVLFVLLNLPRVLQSRPRRQGLYAAWIVPVDLKSRQVVPFENSCEPVLLLNYLVPKNIIPSRKLILVVVVSNHNLKYLLLLLLLLNCCFMLNNQLGRMLEFFLTLHLDCLGINLFALFLTLLSLLLLFLVNLRHCFIVVYG